MAEIGKTETDQALAERLKKLKVDIGESEAEHTAELKSKNTVNASNKTAAAGMRIFSELVAGIVVGSFIGWQLDSWLGTKPWLLLCFFFLGTASGFMSLFRNSNS
jgi:ATP synthase protein I